MFSVDPRAFEKAVSRIERKIETATSEAIREGSEKGAVRILSTAQVSIQRSFGGGAIRPRGDTASLPGEPPRTDTGRLVQSGRVDPDPFGADVVFAANYAIHLEFGTRDMEPRPFLAPALARETGTTAEEAAGVLRENLAR